MSRHDLGGGWLTAGGRGIPRRRRTWCGLPRWVPTCHLLLILRRAERSWGLGHSKKLPNLGLKWRWLWLLSQNLKRILLGTCSNELDWIFKYTLIHSTREDPDFATREGSLKGCQSVAQTKSAHGQLPKNFCSNLFCSINQENCYRCIFFNTTALLRVGSLFWGV